MKNRNRGFTLSEVIITLVVLGIVAAITVPMMNNSANDKKWKVARQKAQATIGEAFRLMTVNGEISTTNLDGTPRTTEYIVTKVLLKYLKLDKTLLVKNDKRNILLQYLIYLPLNVLVILLY